MSEGKKIELYNCDNMELMAKYPDNHFDLAIYQEGREETNCRQPKINF